MGNVKASIDAGELRPKSGDPGERALEDVRRDRKADEPEENPDDLLGLED